MTLNNKLEQSLKSILIMMFLTQIISCAFAPWEKATAKAQTPEEDLAIAKKALAQKPDDIKQNKNLLVTQEEAVAQLSTLADQAKAKGQYQAANDFYNRILSFLQKTQRLLVEKLKLSD